MRRHLSASRGLVTSDRLPRLILFSRSYCHLCQDMLAALEVLRGELVFDFHVVDVDSDQSVLARYDELVPVLEGGGQELCHYFLDEAKVREYVTHFR